MADQPGREERALPLTNTRALTPCFALQRAAGERANKKIRIGESLCSATHESEDL